MEKLKKQNEIMKTKIEDMTDLLFYYIQFIPTFIKIFLLFKYSFRRAKFFQYYIYEKRRKYKPYM